MTFPLVPLLNSARRLPLAAALMLAFALPAQADSVTDWNALASGPVVAPRFGGPQQQARMMAITSIAVHDALNSIDRRYDSYNKLPHAAPGASPNAAVAAAARNALLAMIGALPPAVPPEDANRALAIQAIEAAYAAAIGPGAPDAAEAAGIAAGEAAADEIIAQRYAATATGLVPIDGSGTPNSPPYALPPGPGVHQPTPAPEFPAVTIPAFTGWSAVTPFTLKSATQFRAPPGKIFKLNSLRYAAEYAFVKHVGDARVRGGRPNSPASDIPRFWAGGGLDWNANARLVAANRGLGRWKHARLFALLNIAISDAHVTNMESKYFYSFWRPVTAIRWANDGNPLTRSDPTWRPFLQTPPYPDYPCASTGLTGAAAQTLRRFFHSDALPFTRTVNAAATPLPAPLIDLPPKAITRSYARMTHAENEQAIGRVYAGIHFLEGCTAGLRMGNQVADWVYARHLRPR
jgi:hypothetical protein